LFQTRVWGLGPHQMDRTIYLLVRTRYTRNNFMVAVALTVGVSIVVAIGMPPRMSGAVTTAEGLFVPYSNCI
jgi:hypothetical protein